MNIQVVNESGVGTYVVVSAEAGVIKSTPVTGEWTDDIEKNAIDEIAMTLKDDEATNLYAEYDIFVEARKNAEAEAAYRAEHPEEFEAQDFISDNVEYDAVPEEV